MIKKIASTIGGLALLLTSFNELKSQEFYNHSFQPQVNTQYHQTPLTNFTFDRQTSTQNYPNTMPYNSMQGFNAECEPICIPYINAECQQGNWNQIPNIKNNFHNHSKKLLKGIGNLFHNRNSIKNCEPRGYFHPPIQTPFCPPMDFCPPVNPYPQPCDPCAPYSNSQSTIIFEQSIIPAPQMDFCPPVNPCPPQIFYQPQSVPYQTPTLAPQNNCGCD